MISALKSATNSLPCRFPLAGVRSSHTLSTESLLHTALKYVPEHGWDGAIVESMRHHSMSDQGASIFSPTDLIRHHYKINLQKLRDYNRSEKSNGSEFVKLYDYLIYRLEQNKELGPERLSDAISITAKSDPLVAAECLSDVADELWFKAGDRSNDTTWYTRRAALAGIYGALETAQALDISRDMRGTRALARKLVRGLENAEYVESSVAEWLQFNAIASYNVFSSWR